MPFMKKRTKAAYGKFEQRILKHAKDNFLLLNEI
jgi:hypothetical protein